MKTTPYDIELLKVATNHKLNKSLRERLRKLVNNSKEADKIKLAMDYSHSVTKEEMRGTR